MRELGLDLTALRNTFVSAQATPYAIVEIPPNFANTLAVKLGPAVRRCYIADDVLDARHAESGITKRGLVAVKLPDPGSVMSGDFGEILTALFQAVTANPHEVLDAKKWRLKNDRTKPAPGSDVVQLILPDWPNASSEDRLICSEVKTKSTRGSSSPIKSAISDSKKDSDGRLAKTLVWLRERAKDTGLGTISVSQLNRFIEAVDYPPAELEFRAVAVICSSLTAAELKDVVPPPGGERALVVITVPNLKQNYESVYNAALESTAEDAESR